MLSRLRSAPLGFVKRCLPPGGPRLPARRPNWLIPTAVSLCVAQTTGSSAIAETMAVRNEPVTVFMNVIKWGRDASRGEVVEVSRVENKNGFPITDVNVECIHTTSQGVKLGQISRKISDHIVGPRAAMYVHGINTDFILETGQRINCRVAQFAKYSIGSLSPAKNTTPPATSPLPPSEQQREAVGASPNARSRKFLAMSATAQLAFWTSYLQGSGANCDKATRTMLQGGIAGLDHWNIACSNRNEFFVGIDDNEGTSSVLNCRMMACWVKY